VITETDGKFRGGRWHIYIAAVPQTHKAPYKDVER